MQTLPSPKFQILICGQSFTAEKVQRVMKPSMIDAYKEALFSDVVLAEPAEFRKSSASNGKLEDNPSLSTPVAAEFTLRKLERFIDECKCYAVKQQRQVVALERQPHAANIIGHLEARHLEVVTLVQKTVSRRGAWCFRYNKTSIQ
eukprot:s1774_g13.t1